MKERLDANINWPRYLPVQKVRPTAVSDWIVRLMPSGREIHLSDEEWNAALPAQSGSGVMRREGVARLAWERDHAVENEQREREEHDELRAEHLREIERLQALLALPHTGQPVEGWRETVIEECAKIAENYPPRLLSMWERPGGPPGNGYVDVNGQVYIAQAIRALASPHKREN